MIDEHEDVKLTFEMDSVDVKFSELSRGCSTPWETSTKITSMIDFNFDLCNLMNWFIHL